MRLRSIITITAAAVLVCGAVAVTADQELGGPGPMDHPRMHGPMGMGGAEMGGPFGMLGLPLHRLDLTQEQQDKIHALVEAQRPALQALRTQLRDGGQAFRAAHPVTEFDESAIRDHVAAQAKIQADLAVALARLRSQVVALLTPEQLKTVQEMRTRMHGRMSRDETTDPAPDAPATH